MNNKPKIVFLTGMPGVGKSFYGAYAAQKLGIQFLDLDTEIEKESKNTISELFESIGEKKFRLIEKNTLKKLIKTIDSDTIFATGGGTPCFNNTLNFMKRFGLVVWIDAKPNTLIQNLQSKISFRPLLNGSKNDELYQKLEEMLAKRTYFYSQSDVKVSVYKGLSPDLFTNRLHLSTFAKTA